MTAASANTISAANLVMGPADVYVGAFSLTGAAEPADSAVNTAPAASGWTPVGGTASGVTWTVNQTYKALVVDQVPWEIERRLTTAVLTVGTQLAEPTLANYQYTLNDSNLVTAASGYDTLDPDMSNPGAGPTYRALLIDGWAPSGKRRRLIVRKVLSTAAVAEGHDKDNQKVFPVTWTGHYVSATLTPYHLIDAKV